VTVRKYLVASIVLALAAFAGGPAWARNPHCAGGIQYLTQAMNDKAKPDGAGMDDYRREIRKAVEQLEQCSKEDPNDLEALGYLAWAYAEVDSMCKAGQAFDQAITAMKTKDPKKIDMVQTNRESYWATSFNKAIASIGQAQDLYNPYTKKPENAAEEGKKAEAKKKYDDALANLDRAKCLKPSDPRTLRNLGTVHAFMGDYGTAEKYFREGLAAAPGDSDLTALLKQTRSNQASALIDAGKYDEAEAFYATLVKEEPKNGDLWSGLGDARFSKAKNAKDDAAKKADYKLAGEAYTKASELNPTSAELAFNSALCYENAQEWALSEAQWRKTLEVRKEDAEAMNELSVVLVEQKKYPEAITVARKAVSLDPKDKNRHRQLGAIYSKASDNLHSKQALLAYLALDKGKPADAPGPSSGAAGTKLAASAGKPDQILLWEAEGQKYETWFYWSKGLAYHFGGGTQLEKTDWGSSAASSSN
jgi:tetratricopeptide (TPR) repeat protein